MLFLMRLNQNDSMNSTVICWKRLFFSVHCFMISTCGTESQFNDGKNEKYYLLIHHKELEELKTFEYEKLLLLKSLQNPKTVLNVAITEEKEKNKSDKRSAFRQSY